MFIEPIGEMTLFAHRVGVRLLDCCGRSKLVDSKWARREAGKRKNPRRGRRKRKASEKAHPGSLLLGCGEKSGRGEKLASGKTHGVGVGRKKQAGKTHPGSLLLRCGKKSGRGEKQASGKKPRRGRRKKKASRENPLQKLYNKEECR